MMTLDSLSEILWASTLTHRVESRFPSRGGILMIAPPGQLKTSLLQSLENQRGVLGYSDMTSITLVEARDNFASHKCHTLLLYDLQKIYERRADTASNIMGSIRSLMDEGFTTASFENVSSSAIQSRARALVLAATTPSFYRIHLKSWEESGLSRRFIFSSFSMVNPEKLEEAVLNENPIEFKSCEVPVPPNAIIPLSMNGHGTHGASDGAFLQYCLGKQVEKVPLILMKKILAVLRWKFERMGRKDRSRDIIGDFSESMRGEGARLKI